MTYFYSERIIIILIGKLSFGILSYCCSVVLFMSKILAITSDANHFLMPFFGMFINILMGRGISELVGLCVREIRGKPLT